MVRLYGITIRQSMAELYQNVYRVYPTVQLWCVRYTGSLLERDTVDFKDIVNFSCFVIVVFFGVKWGLAALNRLERRENGEE